MDYSGGLIKAYLYFQKLAFCLLAVVGLFLTRLVIETNPPTARKLFGISPSEDVASMALEHVRPCCWPDPDLRIL